MTWYMSLTPIMRKIRLLVGALLEKVRITNSHYIGWIFSRGRENPQEVVGVHNYKSVGWTISLGKASLPINSSGIPEAGVNGRSGFSKPLSVALIQVFGRMEKAIRRKRLAKTC